MYDCDNDGSGIPANPQAVAGYGAGGNYEQLVARFPHAHHLLIATHPAIDGDILDCESGDAKPQDFPAWHARQVARGVYRPGGYASIATFMPELLAVVRAANIPHAAWRAWVAHWGQPAIVPSGYDAIQCEQNGSAYDMSACLDDFFAPKPPPPPKYPTLTAAQKGQGDTFVKEWPTIRGHPGALTKQLNDEAYVFMERLGGWKLAKP
jgi:hypothetical protein